MRKEDIIIWLQGKSRLQEINQELKDIEDIEARFQGKLSSRLQKSREDLLKEKEGLLQFENKQKFEEWLKKEREIQDKRKSGLKIKATKFKFRHFVK